METLQKSDETQNEDFQPEHPWLEAPVDMDEDLRFTLDEIRFV